MTAALENFSIQGGVRLDNTSCCVQVCRLTNRAQEAMVAYVAIQIYISSPRSVDEYTALFLPSIAHFMEDPYLFLLIIRNAAILTLRSLCYYVVFQLRFNVYRLPDTKNFYDVCQLKE